VPASPDRSLPGLGLALDPPRVLGLLTEAFDPGMPRPELIEAKAVDVRLSPGERCLVLYRVRLRRPGQRHSVRDLLHVVVGRAGTVNASPPPRGVTAGGLPAGIIALPEAALELRPFPIDPGLPWLASAVDPEILRSRLEVVWAPRRRRVIKTQVTPLAYVPEARAALELRVLAEDSETGLPELRRLVGKIHGRRSPARLFAAHWALWRALGDSIGLAPPVGWVASLQLALQEWLIGQRLSEILGTPGASKPVRKAAYALARVHRQRLPLPTVRGPGREAAQCHRWAAVVQTISPRHAHRVGRLVDGLLAEIERRWVGNATVHGDFHPSNVLVDDGRVSLLDWEQIAFGDALTDVGRFLAALRVSSMRIAGRPDALGSLGEAFLETYAREAEVDERRLRLYEAAALVTSSASPFRLQREGWPEAVELLLDEAERAATAGGGRLLSRRPGRAPAIAIPASEFLENSRSEPRPTGRTAKVAIFYNGHRGSLRAERAFIV